MPAGVGEDKEDQQRGQKTVQKAIRTSQKRETGDDEENWGPGASISKSRPRSVLNTVDRFSYLLNRFCPTGPGGGVDPSCGSDSGGIAGGIKSAVAKAGQIEHAIMTQVGVGFAKLPEPVQALVTGTLKVAFSAWTAGQAMAERVAKERGLDDKQAAKLRSVLATADLIAFKAAKVGAFSGVPGAGLATTISGTLPVASVGYLAYSTARDPVATYRAAKGIVKDVAASVKARLNKPQGSKARSTYKPGVEQLGNSMVTNADTDRIVNALVAHDWDDWYTALLTAALEESNGDLDLALEIAEISYRDNPVANAFCATGEGGGVDPSCSPEGQKAARGKSPTKVRATPAKDLNDTDLDTRIKESYAKLYGESKGLKAKERESLKKQYLEDVAEADQRDRQRLREKNTQQREELTERTEKNVAELRAKTDDVNPRMAHGMKVREEMKGIRQDGINFVYSKDAETAAANSIAELKERRGDIPDKLWKATQEVIFTKQPNSQDAHWAKEFGEQGFVSGATGGDGKIVAYSGNGVNFSTFAHESGHNLATQLWRSTSPPADSNFGRLQQTDSEGRVVNAVTPYGRNSRAEDFAETVRMYVDKKSKILGDKVGTISTPHENLKAISPERFQALEDLLR